MVGHGTLAPRIRVRFLARLPLNIRTKYRLTTLTVVRQSKLYGIGPNALFHDPELIKIFNYLTIPFYWGMIEPKRGEFDLRLQERAIEFCKQNNIRPKGHAMVYMLPWLAPKWAENMNPEHTDKIVENLMPLPIEDWDVVNEPLHYPSDPKFWTQVPGKTRILNEFDIFPFDRINARQTLSYNTHLFDQIGLQMHIPGDTVYTEDEIVRSLDYWADLGKPLNISEISIEPSGQWSEGMKAQYLPYLYGILDDHPAVRSITYWNMGHDDPWRPNSGLIGESYEALKEWLATRIHTSNHKTNLFGSFTFNGPSGTYDILRNGVKVGSFTKP